MPRVIFSFVSRQYRETTPSCAAATLLEERHVRHERVPVEERPHVRALLVDLLEELLEVLDSVLAEPRSLSEGDKVAVGSALFTFTTHRLPLGVAVIDPATATKREKDISTRRNTIKHPILASDLDPDSPRRVPTNIIIGAIAVIVVILYLLGR